MILLTILVTFIFFAFPDIANAGYLDPGSGSTLMQGIAAFMAGIARFFRNLFGRKK